MFKVPAKLWVALAVTLLASMGISLPYPVLTPLFIDAEPSSLNSFYGLSGEVLFTIIIAVYPLGIFIGSSFIGALSDRFGRKRVLAQTLGICFVGYLISAYALYIENYPLLLISRFFTGITEGNVAIARAIALDIGDDESQGISKIRAVSLINSAIFLGWLLGPLIGGVLAHFQPYFAMLAAAVGAVICYLLVKYALAETNQTVSSNKLSLWQAVVTENSLQLIRDNWIRRLFFMYFTYAMAMNLYYEFYPVWLVEEQGFGSLAIGLSTTNMTIFMTLSSIFLATWVQGRFGTLKPMMVVMAMMSLCLFLLPFTISVSTQFIFAYSGAIVAIFNGILPVYISEKQSDKGNGAVMGLLTTTFCLANVFAAMIGGGLLLIGTSAPLFLASGLYVLALVMIWQFFAKTDAAEMAIKNQA